MSYVATVIWACYDGVFATRMWSIIWFEAIFLHRAGIQVGNLLAMILCNPLTGT